MKTITSSLKSIPRTALATLAIAIVSGLSVPSTQAGYTVTMQEIGANVVAIGSGAFDLTGLTLAFANSAGAAAEIIPISRVLVMGSTAGAFSDEYKGSITGPANFGSGGQTFASLGSGDHVGISPTVGALDVPVGYISGTPLLTSDTYNNKTFSTLGVTPGTYVWSWGTGANQNLTLRIGAVPESGSNIILLVLSLGALFGASRFRSLRFG